MYDIGELKKYLKKIQYAYKNPEFATFGYVFVKKTRIDDLFCCLLAVMPGIYKKDVNDARILDKIDKIENFPSLVAFNIFSKAIRQCFFFSKDMYVAHQQDVLNLISNIMKHIDVDIAKLENILGIVEMR